MNVTFRQLRALHAVVTTGSTSAASNKIHITQPAVSRLIGTLEEEVGFEIFERVRGRLKLTESGQMLFDEAGRILDAIEDFGSIADDIREYKTARIRLVATPNIVASDILTDAIARFVEIYPNVRIMIESRAAIEIETFVASGQSDLGLVLRPSESSGIQCETIAHMRMIVALSEDHELAKRKSLTLEDIAPFPIIIPGTGSRLRELIDGIFASVGLTPIVKVETRTSILSCLLASQNVGIGIVDEISGSAIRYHGLVLKRWEPEVSLVYGFLTRVGLPSTPLVRTFRDMVSESFQRRAPIL